MLLDEVPKWLDAVLVDILADLSRLSRPRCTTHLEIGNFIGESANLERLAKLANLVEAHGVGQLSLDPLVEHVHHLLGLPLARLVELLLPLEVSVDGQQGSIPSRVVVFWQPRLHSVS